MGTFIPKDLNSIDDAMKLEVGNILFPAFVRTLIARQLLNLDRLSDPNYVNAVIDAHADDTINDLRVYVSMDKDFLESAHTAVASSKLEVAIVLIATVIEHRLNMFYREALEEQVFNDRASTEII